MNHRPNQVFGRIIGTSRLLEILAKCGVGLSVVATLSACVPLVPAPPPPAPAGPPVLVPGPGPAPGHRYHPTAEPWK